MVDTAAVMEGMEEDIKTAVQISFEIIHIENSLVIESWTSFFCKSLRNTCG